MKKLDRSIADNIQVEPHGQSPLFPRDAHKGRTSRTRGPIHPRVEPVVLLVWDRISQTEWIKDRRFQRGMNRWGESYFRNFVMLLTLATVSLICLASFSPGISSTSFFKSEIRFPSGSPFSFSFSAFLSPLIFLISFKRLPKAFADFRKSFGTKQEEENDKNHQNFR